MKKNPKFYIVFPYTMVDEINWPEGAPYACVANVGRMLQYVLNVKSIGGELKLIWNNQHRWEVIEKNDITYQQLNDYLKADCSLLSFKTEFMRKRSIKALGKMGGKGFVCVGSYREVLLYQAFHYINKRFPTALEHVELTKPKKQTHEKPIL